MLKIEKFVTMSPAQYEIVMEGMRNPKNSWERSDSYTTHICDEETLQTADFAWFMGDNDHALAEGLAVAGPVHAKYRRMMPVYLTITAPFYWWKEFDTYKVGTVCNSCSTMHKIHEKPFELKDFSWEGMTNDGIVYLEWALGQLESNRQTFITSRDPEIKKLAWNEMIKLLPSCYEQKRTIMLNYEVLAGIYEHRRDHKLNEWHIFCEWIRGLPYSELITGEITPIRSSMLTKKLTIPQTMKPEEQSKTL